MQLTVDFYRIKGYEPLAEGAWSFQHILFTLIMIIVMIFLGIFLGLKYKNNEEAKITTIKVTAISINAFEIFKIIFLCIKYGDPIGTILRTLPLFLCSIMLIALPIAGFSKGRLRESALDFILIFGFIAGVLGTVGAVQNYSSYPVISIQNLSSAITHCISAFSSLFIGITGMASLKPKNIWISLLILFVVVLLAQIANYLIPFNYMFLESHDGTPYSIVYNIVNGNLMLYKFMVVGLFVLLISIFYLVKFLSKYKIKFLKLKFR